MHISVGSSAMSSSGKSADTHTNMTRLLTAPQDLRSSLVRCLLPDVNRVVQPVSRLGNIHTFLRLSSEFFVSFDQRVNSS